MANFNGPEEKMAASFKTSNNLLCPRCGKYGRVSFQVLVKDQKGQNIHTVNSVVCLFCREGERYGLLITLFTGPVGKPDLSCRNTKVPIGYTLEDLRRALEKETLWQWFHYAELGVPRRMF